VRRKALVDGLCEMLELGGVQDCVVGTVQRRGISGGQKKRVNVGVELAADPTALLLDEPTSGLASTDTLCLVQCLSSFARRNRTVVAVIHQPRHTVRAPVSWSVAVG
jgi:ABC-type multidrug transport system ATPase subunit